MNTLDKVFLIIETLLYAGSHFMESDVVVVNVFLLLKDAWGRGQEMWGVVLLIQYSLVSCVEDD